MVYFRSLVLQINVMKTNYLGNIQTNKRGNEPKQVDKQQFLEIVWMHGFTNTKTLFQSLSCPHPACTCHHQPTTDKHLK